MLDAARVVADIIPADIKVLNTPGVPSTRYVPDISHARDLGCEETIGLREAIRRVIND